MKQLADNAVKKLVKDKTISKICTVCSGNDWNVEVAYLALFQDESRAICKSDEIMLLTCKNCGLILNFNYKIFMNKA